jgi:hypothetical protein
MQQGPPSRVGGRPLLVVLPGGRSHRVGVT